MLLVEDERAIGDLLRLSLLAEGYAVDLVTTDADAQKRIDRVPYDLVISDWRLGEGGDGRLIVNHAADRGMKTMLISGYLIAMTDPDPRHEYLMKPMRPSELIAAVERIIGPAHEPA